MVVVGQLWADNDSRLHGAPPRIVRVVSIGTTHAVVENHQTGKRTLIALKRFRPNANGYRLIEDVTK